jgi:zinc transport system ATP-binding protein
MSQLICKNIFIAYEKENVVEDFSMTVEKGDYISVIGENGTGKSSLLKGILGIVPLKSGTVEFDDGVRRDNIGYLSQQSPLQKDFPATCYEVVLSGCLTRKGILPWYKKNEKELAYSNMEKLGIVELAKKSFADLSGGQRQRVLLARALCATDKIIFLDEPITGLDPIATRDFYNIIEQLNKEGITIIMITHDVDNALKYSNKVLHMHKYKYFFGNKAEYLVKGGCTEECMCDDHKKGGKFYGRIY